MSEHFLKILYEALQKSQTLQENKKYKPVSHNSKFKNLQKYQQIKTNNAYNIIIPNHMGLITSIQGWFNNQKASM